MADRKKYPAYQKSREGIKVAWRYYADKADADKAAEVARHNAEIDRAAGYDFGYNAPGTINGPMTALQWDGEYTGLYEVCIP